VDDASCCNGGWLMGKWFTLGQQSSLHLTPGRIQNCLGVSNSAWHYDAPSILSIMRMLLLRLVPHHIFVCSPQWISFPNNMGFPCSLATDEMALYILDKFAWYRRDVVFPTGPLAYDYGECARTLVLLWLKCTPKSISSPNFHRWCSWRCC